MATHGGTCTLPTPTCALLPAGDDLSHYYCCDPDLSLCGLDLSRVPESRPPLPNLCRVCEALDRSVHCARGWTP